MKTCEFHITEVKNKRLLRGVMRNVMLEVCQSLSI